jgi:CRISPR/Cas system-associated protein Cas7 (RAMP superfamily)
MAEPVDVADVALMMNEPRRGSVRSRSATRRPANDPHEVHRDQIGRMAIAGDT